MSQCRLDGNETLLVAHTVSTHRCNGESDGLIWQSVSRLQLQTTLLGEAVLVCVCVLRDSPRRSLIAIHFTHIELIINYVSDGWTSSALVVNELVSEKVNLTESCFQSACASLSVRIWSNVADRAICSFRLSRCVACKNYGVHDDEKHSATCMITTRSAGLNYSNVCDPSANVQHVQELCEPQRECTLICCSTFARCSSFETPMLFCWGDDLLRKSVHTL